MTVDQALPTRDRILRAAADLLQEGGRDAVSTRAVSAAAGVQAPALYRLFGDKDGLLDAVASYGFEEYLGQKHDLGATGDPVGDLRRGWDLHIQFGLTRPAFYALMYGEARPGGPSPAAKEAAAILHGIISRIAEAGQLTMSVERAAELTHSTGVGVVLSLIALPPAERDLEISTVAREMVVHMITTDEPAPAAGLATRAVALRAALTGELPFSPAEQALLSEWLDRLADG
ncbi:TetR/AcrR family transcriptional regulator [Amycolatopsis magusensis]|uniref:TetR/AcrR family transcriptional regulator n=1 Tax=Amycolatopsis magusensis TaxID=882444 RepID=UPI0037B2E8DE